MSQAWFDSLITSLQSWPKAYCSVVVGDGGGVGEAKRLVQRSLSSSACFLGLEKDIRALSTYMDFYTLLWSSMYVLRIQLKFQTSCTLYLLEWVLCRLSTSFKWTMRNFPLLNQCRDLCAPLSASFAGSRTVAQSIGCTSAFFILPATHAANTTPTRFSNVFRNVFKHSVSLFSTA